MATILSRYKTVSRIQHYNGQGYGRTIHHKTRRAWDRGMGVMGWYMMHDSVGGKTSGMAWYDGAGVGGQEHISSSSQKRSSR